MHKVWHLISIFLLSISTGFASQPLLQARYDIDDIQDSSPGISWRVSGNVADATPLGYGANDTTTGMVVFCENEFGDIDRFIITNIVSTIAGRLVCDVIYNETGTPRFGSPMSGAQIICSVSTNGIPYIPSYTVDGFSEYLQNGARNISLDHITSGGGGTGDVSTWSTYPAIQAVNLADNPLTNVSGITLGGEYRTNWPTGGGVLVGTNQVTGSFTIDPSGLTIVNFGYTFPVNPYVSFTIRDTNATLLATPTILALTNYAFAVAFISSGDLITYPWNVDYFATVGAGGSGGTGDVSTWSFYPALTNVDLNNKNIDNIASMTSTGIANFKTIAINYSGEQELNSGDTISPYSNIRINSTNSGIISLGDPQILTNGITDGTIIFIKGAEATEGIQLINGQGILTDCELSFLIKPNDMIQFMYLDDKWIEMKRVDK